MGVQIGGGFGGGGGGITGGYTTSGGGTGFTGTDTVQVGEGGQDYVTSLALGTNPVVAGVSALVYGIAAYESYEAGQDAKEAASRAAAVERETAAEEVRVVSEENERTESLARARAAASGLSGASSELYIAALAESGREDIAWLKKVGESRAESQLDRGSAAYHQAMSQMWGNVGGMVSSAGRFAGVLA